MLVQKLATDLFVFCVEVFIIEVYPIETRHIGKGAVEVSGFRYYYSITGYWIATVIQYLLENDQSFIS